MSSLPGSRPVRADSERDHVGAATLTLYTRAGCPLCEEMEAAVSNLLRGTRHSLECVDVDADPLLKSRFGWEVPLLFDGNAELCRHELSLPAFQEWLRVRA